MPNFSNDDELKTIQINRINYSEIKRNAIGKVSQLNKKLDSKVANLSFTTVI